MSRVTRLLLVFAAIPSLACSGTPPPEPEPVIEPEDGGTTPEPMRPETGAPPDDSQVPPEGEAATRAWLDSGAYLGWACEPAVHRSRSPSPHGYNRICSNRIIAENARGSGAWPAGAAAVKELYSDASGKTLIGYSVYSKIDADSANGNGWYWYERYGSSLFVGRGASACIGCHGGAGTSAATTPTEGGRDYVFTPVE
jgi:hypothetical protein